MPSEAGSSRPPRIPSALRRPPRAMPNECEPAPEDSPERGQSCPQQRTKTNRRLNFPQLATADVRKTLCDETRWFAAADRNFSAPLRRAPVPNRSAFACLATCCDQSPAYPGWGAQSLRAVIPQREIVPPRTPPVGSGVPANSFFAGPEYLFTGEAGLGNEPIRMVAGLRLKVILASVRFGLWIFLSFVTRASTLPLSCRGRSTIRPSCVTGYHGPTPTQHAGFQFDPPALNHQRRLPKSDDRRVVPAFFPS